MDKHTRIISILVLTFLVVLMLTTTVGAAEEQLIKQEVIASYFDVWRSGDWQDTDNKKPEEDMPGQRKEADFTYTAEELLDEYTITRAEVIYPVDEDLYNEAGGRKTQPNGRDGEMPWERFNDWYNMWLADIQDVGVDNSRVSEGRAVVEWDIILKAPGDWYAADLTDKDVREYLGLPENYFWTTLNEGYRWYMPGVIRWYGIPKQAPDLYVKNIDPGTCETEGNQQYSGTVTFGLKDTVDTPVKARLEMTHNGYKVAAVDGRIVTFNPGEEKSFDFTFVGIEAEDSVLTAKIIPVQPDTDVNWDNNTKSVTVPAVGVEIPEGDPHLKLTATSQGGEDVHGVYHPPEQRPPGTAKLSDIITAEFEAPSAPSLSPCYHLETWELQKATIIYPKKAEGWSFGHPLPPEGTVSKAMKIDKENNTATIDFEEDWSMNGAFVYDMLAGKKIDGPTTYNISVEYEMLWEYEKGKRVCETNSEGKTSCHCEDYHFRSRTRTGTVTAQILVNGTGVVPYGQ